MPPNATSGTNRFVVTQTHDPFPIHAQIARPDRLTSTEEMASILNRHVRMNPNFVPDEPVSDGSVDEMSPEEAKEKKFLQSVRIKIENGQQVRKSDLDRYLKTVRKKRHLTRAERRYIHKPKKNKVKTTVSFDIDDLVPA